MAVSNTDKPLVKQPESNANAVDAYDALGHQADKLDGEAGRRGQDSGLVTRDELNEILQQHQAQMQSMVSLFQMFQKNDPRQDSPVTQNVLEVEREVYEHTIAELTTAPKESVYIVPLPYEASAIEQNDGKPLYRVICINGIQWPVEVGAVTLVPQQIAELIRDAKAGQMGTWRQQLPGPPIMRHEKQSAQDLETIPRPPKMAGADEMGRSGVVSTDVFRPFTGERATPLDAR